MAHRNFLAKALSNEGNEISLISGVFKDNIPQDELEHLQFHELPLELHRFSLIGDLRLIYRYIQLIRALKPDIVHAITIKPVLYMSLAILIMRMLGSRHVPELVITFPGLGKIFEPGSGILVRLRRFVVSYCLRFTSTITKSTATFENFQDRADFVKSGIIPRSRARVVMGAGINRKHYFWQARTGDPVILFASRLLRAKGVELFIEAAKELKSEFPKAVFQIAGGNELSNPDRFNWDKLKEEIDAGNIEYLGFLSSAKMSVSLRKADIHCAPSLLREGLPRVVLEAAASGCYIIASDHKMVRKIVRNDESGWILNPITQEELTSAIRHALSDINAARRMGKKASQLSQDFPIFEEDVILRFTRIYHECLERRNR